MLSEISKTVVVMDPSSPDWHPGCQSRPALPADDVERPRSGTPALLHIRDPAAREPDTNVGWWILPDLRAGRTYTFSCEAYLPGDFAGKTVRLCLGHPLARDVTADPSIRDRWQPLSLELRSTQDLAELAVILRVDSDVETTLYSSAWTLECVTVETVAATPIPISPTVVAEPIEIPAVPASASIMPATEPISSASIPSQPQQINELTEGEQFIAKARAMAEGREPSDLALLVSAYGRGAGSYFDHLHHQARVLIDEVARHSPAFADGKSLFDDSRAVRRDIIAALCPELLPGLYHHKTNEELEEIPLLEPCPNGLMDDRLPSTISVLRHLARRPAVSAYTTTDACVYAHPYRYQVLSRDRSAMWLSGSPRGLSRDAIGATELVEVDKDIVVLQDRFNFSAIPHFLFDGVSRALLLAQALGDLRLSLLVFGGIPGEFHAAIRDVLCDKLNLTPENFLFPNRALTIETTRRCIWFSDQTETYLHPAQMAHPSSINLLRTIAEALPGEPSDARYVYLPPPGDALLNEEVLRAVLESRGFVTIPTDRLSVAQRIGVFRNAEIVVAPHGPDLTYLIVADRLSQIVELFPPGSGTDAYSLIAAAGGIRHTPIIGTGDASRYEIDVDETVHRIASSENSRNGPSWHWSANLLPGSRAMLGLRGDPETIVAEPSPSGLVAGNAVITHHGGPDVGSSSVVGRWPGLRLIPGLRYTASCWIYVPEQFAGMEIALHMTGSAVGQVGVADLTRRGLWQRLILTATPLGTECDLQLRVISPAPTSFASTCWQLERGNTATAYIATP